MGVRQNQRPPYVLHDTAYHVHHTDLQHRLDLGRDVSLLVKLDALFVGPGRALRCNLLQVGQHYTVGLGHCLELVEQELQKVQQQPVEGAREGGKGGEVVVASNRGTGSRGVRRRSKIDRP